MKKILILALPLILQSAVTFATGFMNNMMSSRLGNEVQCGVYMGNQVQLFLQLFAVGIDGAIIILTSRHVSARNEKTAHRYAVFGVQLSVFFGILSTIICFFAPKFILTLFTQKSDFVDTGSSYLRILSLSFPFYMLTGALISTQRGAKNTKTGLFILSSFLLVNGFLNYALMFGKLGAPRLSSDGAAIGTMITRIAESAFTLFYSKRKAKIRLGVKDFIRFDLSCARDFLKLGAPIMLAQAIWGINTLFSSAVMGKLGPLTTESFSVSIALNNLSYCFASGLSAAIGIEISYALGKEDTELAKRICQKSQISFIGIGVVTSVLIFALKPLFLLIYSPSADAMAFINSFILLLAIFAPFTCYQSLCLSSIIKSGGDTPFILKAEGLSVLFIITTTIITLKFNPSPILILAILKSDQIIKCLPSYLKIKYGRWIIHFDKNE